MRSSRLAQPDRANSAAAQIAIVENRLARRVKEGIRKEERQRFMAPIAWTSASMIGWVYF